VVGDTVNALAAGLVLLSTGYCCPPYCHLTASGTQVRPGVVAATPPFGTRLHIDGLEGEYVVEDRGVGPGSIDIFFASCADAWRWGRRPVLVELVTPEPVPGEEEDA
jgi:3D (Asp-Asp-Asp) domain-containing protein